MRDAAPSTYFLRNVCRDRRFIEDYTGGYQVANYPVTARQQRRLSRNARFLQAESQGAGLHVGRRVLDLADCGLPGRAGAADLSVRHGAGGRRIDHVSAEARVSLSGRRHGFARRPLPRLRCERERHRLWQRRGRGAVEAARGRGRRRRPDLCGDPRICHQQRRLGQSRLHRAERRGAGAGDCHGAGAGGRFAGVDRLYRGARNRDAAGRSDRTGGADAGVSRPHQSAAILRRRHGEDQRRAISISRRALRD